MCGTLKFLFQPFVEPLPADLHRMPPDAARTACISFSHWQTAGSAFMFGGVNRLEVRRFAFGPPLIFCPLATHRQELSAQLWASLMRLTDVASCSAHRFRGREGAREATAGAFVHTRSRSASEWVAVWAS